MKWLILSGLVMLLILAGLVMLSGCAPYKASVFGASGKAYTAPEMCGALVSCLNSGETSCYYNKVVISTATGGTETSGCTEIKKDK